jgi:GR25 family glycosyltransferase involved in LPS biosynthesis
MTSESYVQMGGRNWGKNGALLRGQILKDYFSSMPNNPKRIEEARDETALQWLDADLKSYFSKRFEGSAYNHKVMDTFFADTPKQNVLRVLQPYNVDVERYVWSNEGVEDFTNSDDYLSSLQKAADNQSDKLLDQRKEQLEIVQQQIKDKAYRGRGGGDVALLNIKDDLINVYRHHYGDEMIGTVGDYNNRLLNDMLSHFADNYDEILRSRGYKPEEIEPVFESIVHHYFTNPKTSISDKVTQLLYPSTTNVMSIDQSTNGVLPESPYHIDTNVELFTKSGNMLSNAIPYNMDISLTMDFIEQQRPHVYLKSNIVKDENNKGRPLAWPDTERNEDGSVVSKYPGLENEVPLDLENNVFAPETGPEAMWRLQLGNESAKLQDEYFQNATGIDAGWFTAQMKTKIQAAKEDNVNTITGLPNQNGGNNHSSQSVYVFEHALSSDIQTGGGNNVSIGEVGLWNNQIDNLMTQRGGGYIDALAVYATSVPLSTFINDATVNAQSIPLGVQTGGNSPDNLVAAVTFHQSANTLYQDNGDMLGDAIAYDATGGTVITTTTTTMPASEPLDRSYEKMEIKHWSYLYPGKELMRIIYETFRRQWPYDYYNEMNKRLKAYFGKKFQVLTDYQNYMTAWFGNDQTQNKLMEIMFDLNSPLNEVPLFVNMMREFSMSEYFPNIPANSIGVVGTQTRMAGGERSRSRERSKSERSSRRSKSRRRDHHDSNLAYDHTGLLGMFPGFIPIGGFDAYRERVRQLRLASRSMAGMELRHHIINAYTDELGQYHREHALFPHTVLMNDMHNLIYSRLSNHNLMDKTLGYMFPKTMTSTVNMFRLMNLSGVPEMNTKYMIPDEFLKTFVNSGYFLRLDPHRLGQRAKIETNDDDGKPDLRMVIPQYMPVQGDSEVRELAKAIGRVVPPLNPGDKNVVEYGQKAPNLVVDSTVDPLLGTVTATLPHPTATQTNISTEQYYIQDGKPIIGV